MTCRRHHLTTEAGGPTQVVIIGQHRAAESRTSTPNIAHQTLKNHPSGQCLSQDLETGCLKLAVVKFLGVQIYKGDHNILIFQQ